jgi:hypothetical protein
MEHVKSVLLVGSILLNIVFIAFVVILQFTPYFDIPLAAYSHTKNCEKDFEDVLKMADKLPAEQQAPAKQAFASILCQKDYQTGRPISDQNFSAILKQLQDQAPAGTAAPAQ